MTTRIETKGSGVFNERRLEYTFDLDYFPVRSDSGKQIGSASVFGYVADVPDEERVRRPVTFVFNGGPGASSAFLHLSGIGPKRIAFPEDLSAGARPPYAIEESVHSYFDVSDLVFIDPVNTGYGRTVSDTEIDALYSLEGDARYFGAIVRAWLAREGRWNSPKYILGESYGTHRAPFLASALMGFDCVPLDGIILLGQALNVQETMERPGNVCGAIAGLPVKAVTAWYHGIGAQAYSSADEVVDAALEFAFGEFASALMKGNRLSESERTEIAEKLERLTGIPAKTYTRHRLCLGKERFRNELFSERRLVVGVTDSRYLGVAVDDSVGEAPFEPDYVQILPAYTSGINCYLGQTLGIGHETEYRLVDPQATPRWDWSDTGSKNFMQMGKPSPFETYPYVARLTQFMKQVPHARLFIGTGIYDTLTTIGAVEHLLRQYELPLERVTERRYPAGHLMYTDRLACEQLNRDLRRFVTDSAVHGERPASDAPCAR